MSENVTTESASNLHLAAHIHLRMTLSDIHNSKITEQVYLTLKRRERNLFSRGYSEDNSDYNDRSYSKVECNKEHLDNRIQYVGQELSKYMEMPRPTDYDMDLNEISEYTQNVIEWLKDSRHTFISISNDNRRLEKDRLAQSMAQNATIEPLYPMLLSCEQTVKRIFHSLKEVQQILDPKKKRSCPSPEAAVVVTNGTNDETDELSVRLQKIHKGLQDLAVTRKEYTNEAFSLSANIARVEGWPSVRSVHIEKWELDRAVEKIVEETVNDIVKSLSSQVADDHGETALYGHRLANPARFAALQMRKDAHLKQALSTLNLNNCRPGPSTPMEQLNLLREYRRQKQRRSNGIKSKSAINTISRVLEETPWN